MQRHWCTIVCLHCGIVAIPAPPIAPPAPQLHTWQPMVMMWKVLPFALAGAGRDITWPATVGRRAAAAMNAAAKLEDKAMTHATATPCELASKSSRSGGLAAAATAGGSKWSARLHRAYPQRRKTATPSRALHRLRAAKAAPAAARRGLGAVWPACRCCRASGCCCVVLPKC